MKMSAELSAKITAAKAELLSESGITLKVQGFNPRPEKAPVGKGGGYRFGTLSEHAQGNAVDIDPDRNLFVPNDTWNYILAQPNITKPKGDLTLHRWVTDPEGMYEDLATVSDTWRDEARRRFEVEKRVRQEAGSLVPGLREPVVEGLVVHSRERWSCRRRPFSVFTRQSSVKVRKYPMRTRRPSERKLLVLHSRTCQA